MVGTLRESSGSSSQASAPSQKQASADAAGSTNKDQKSCTQSTTRSLLQECVAGEMAQPEVGVSCAEQRMWGEIFQSRQNFVDMHCC
ncbi:hypothetical protein ACOMHN_035960 [Nucella lapillus]